jgi:hypothetical protein
MSVGMPQFLLLKEFGQKIYDAFGAIPYHVGSSVENKNWRDVDVRLILSDKVYDELELGDPKYPHENLKWCSLCLAYSILGKQITGLPIDFQIQQQSLANKSFEGTRSALYLSSLRKHIGEE